MGSLSNFSLFFATTSIMSQKMCEVIWNMKKPREHKRVNTDSGLPTWFTLENAQFWHVGIAETVVLKAVLGASRYAVKLKVIELVTSLISCECQISLLPIDQLPVYSSHIKLPVVSMPWRFTYWRCGLSCITHLLQRYIQTHRHSSFVDQHTTTCRHHSIIHRAESKLFWVNSR